MLVTSFNPLEAFIYKEGFARLATVDYTQGDLSNKYVHLTNSSIQRHNSNADAVMKADGTKLTLSDLKKALKKNGIDFGKNIWPQIKDLVVKSLLAGQISIPHNPNCFELFG